MIRCMRAPSPLSPEEIRRYHDRGYLTVANFLAPQQLDGVERYLQQHEGVAWQGKSADPMREATTRIPPRQDRKQYLVRGSATNNGNEYMHFGE